MRCRQSARFTPAPAIRINTSPAFGSGTGRGAGTSISGPPGDLISMTVWVAGILASTGRSSRWVGMPDDGIRSGASVSPCLPPKCIPTGQGRLSGRYRPAPGCTRLGCGALGDALRFDKRGREDMSILQDKVVVVPGAGAGIGRATALGMAEAGANIAVADIDLAAARRTADQAAGNARRAIAIEAECGDVASIDAMIARTVAELGRLDVIVNNAGVTRYAQ